MAYKYKKKKLYLGRIVGRQGDLNGGHSWKVLKLTLHDYFYPSMKITGKYKSVETVT